jgi:hypothetical protein
MRRNVVYRIQAAALLALVALLGALAGVLGDRMLTHYAQERNGTAVAFRPGRPPGAGVWRWEPRPAGRYADLLATRLELSPEQRTEIDRVLAEEQARVRELTREVGPQFRAIAEQTRQRVEVVLTDAQREQLRALRQERMRGRRHPGPGALEGPARRRIPE